MKRTNLKKALAFVFAFALLVCAVMAVSVSAADETEPKVEIVSNNVYYGDTMRLMYAVHTENADGYELSVDIYDAEDNLLCEAVSGSTIEEIGGTDTVNELECSIFVMPTGVPAQNISAEFYAVAKLSNGTDEIKSEKHKYSVLEYLYERLFVTDGVAEEKKEMYRKLIDYAKVAEAVLTDTPEGERISDYTYAYVAKGTIGENNSHGIYKVGDVIANLRASIEVPAGSSLSWQIEYYDLYGKLKESSLVAAEELGEITLTEYVFTATPVVTSKAYTLVTDANQLKNGAQIVIVACDYDYAMSTEQKSNNRGRASVTKNGNTVTFGDDVQVITLVDKGNNQYSLQVEGGYLCSAGKSSSSNNYLRTDSAGTSDNCLFDITINGDGSATVKANGAESNNYMQYYSSGLFACYKEATSQKAICIYVLE